MQSFPRLLINLKENARPLPADDSFLDLAPFLSVIQPHPHFTPAPREFFSSFNLLSSSLPRGLCTSHAPCLSCAHCWLLLDTESQFRHLSPEKSLLKITLPRSLSYHPHVLSSEHLSLPNIILCMYSLSPLPECKIHVMRSFSLLFPQCSLMFKCT